MQRRNKPHFEVPEDLGPSRTQVKHAAEALQELATELLALPDAQLDDIEMEESLRDALRTLRGLKDYEARRRQAQYVGKLMRDADEEPLQRAIKAYRKGDALIVQETERWLERLLADDGALTAWLEAHPTPDTQRLRTLIRNARREVAAAVAADPEGAPPRKKGRLTRELYQQLRAGLQPVPAAREE